MELQHTKKLLLQILSIFQVEEKNYLREEFLIYNDTRFYSLVNVNSWNFKKQLKKVLNISAKNKVDQLKC